MRLAWVIGRVSATAKTVELSGLRLLVADYVDADGGILETGIVLTDACDAGPGDIVLVATGSAARQAGALAGVPTDATAVGIVDHMSIGSRDIDLDALRRDGQARDD